MTKENVPRVEEQDLKEGRGPLGGGGGAYGLRVLFKQVELPSLRVLRLPSDSEGDCGLPDSGDTHGFTSSWSFHSLGVSWAPRYRRTSDLPNPPTLYVVTT